MKTTTRSKLAAQVRVEHLISEINLLRSEIKKIQNEITESQGEFIPKSFNSLLEALAHEEDNFDKKLKVSESKETNSLMIQAINEKINRCKDEIASYIPYSNVWIKVFFSNESYGIFRGESGVFIHAWDSEIME